MSWTSTQLEDVGSFHASGIALDGFKFAAGFFRFIFRSVSDRHYSWVSRTANTCIKVFFFHMLCCQTNQHSRSVDERRRKQYTRPSARLLRSAYSYHKQERSGHRPKAHAKLEPGQQQRAESSTCIGNSRKVPASIAPRPRSGAPMRPGQKHTPRQALWRHELGQASGPQSSPKTTRRHRRLRTRFCCFEIGHSAGPMPCEDSRRR